MGADPSVPNRTIRPTRLIGFKGYGLAEGRDFHADVGGTDPSLAAAGLAYELMTCITSRLSPGSGRSAVEKTPSSTGEEAEVTVQRALDTFCVLRVLQLSGFFPSAASAVGPTALEDLMSVRSARQTPTPCTDKRSRRHRRKPSR